MRTAVKHLAIARNLSVRRLGLRAPHFVHVAVFGLALAVSSGALAQATSKYIAELKPTVDATSPDQNGRITLILNSADETVRFQLRVSGVDRVVGSHFHTVRWRTLSSGTQIYLDPAEGEGPIVQFFIRFDSKGMTGNGLISEGVFKRSDLIGEFSKRPFGDLVEQLDSGHFYATVHALERRNKAVYCCPVVLRGFFEPAGE